MTATLPATTRATAEFRPPVASADRRARWAAGLLGVVAVAVALLLPTMVSSRLLNVAVTAGILSLAAYGVALTYGLVGSLSVGVSVAWGGAAFAAAHLSAEAGLAFPLVCLAAMATATAVAFVVALPCARTGGHYFVILTFAVAEIIYILAEQTPALNNQSVGISTFETIEVLGLSLTDRTSVYYLVVGTVAVVGVAFVLVRRSWLGRRFVSIRENEELARSFGVQPLRWKLLGFALSGIPPGLAGALYAYYLHSVTVEAFGILNAITVVLVAVLGGARSGWGPPVGAFVMLFVPEALGLSPMLQQLSYGVAICVVILVLPLGVVPSLQAALRRALRDPVPDRRSQEGPPT